MKCSISEKVYEYAIYKEPDATYSISMDEKDIILLSVINYETPEKILSSMENYYKKMVVLVYNTNY